MTNIVLTDFYVKVLAHTVLTILFYCISIPPNASSKEMGDTIKHDDILTKSVVFSMKNKTVHLVCYAMFHALRLSFTIYLLYQYPEYAKWSYVDILIISVGITSSLVRLWCFATLSKFFTFELAIRKDHKLVTNGPYNVVRHPSYITLYLAVLCWFGSFADTHSYRIYLKHLGMTDWYDYLIIPWAVLHIATFIGILVILLIRVANEEKLMEEHFDLEWKQYKKKVPYKMIPYVF